MKPFDWLALQEKCPTVRPSKAPLMGLHCKNCPDPKTTFLSVRAALDERRLIPGCSVGVRHLVCLKISAFLTGSFLFGSLALTHAAPSLSQDAMGMLIGKGGSGLREMQEKTGVKVNTCTDK